MANIRVLEVATFYTMFNLAPVGRFHVQFCGTTPCMLRGADELKKVCTAHDRRARSSVSADGKFSWNEVECLGACVNAPMVQIKDDYYEDLTPETLTRILDDLAAGKTPKPGPQIDRQLPRRSAAPTTLTDPAIYDGYGVSRVAADRQQAKKPGEAANVQEAPMPTPPIGDATDPRRQ